jgi:hypothetical protein
MEPKVLIAAKSLMFGAVAKLCCRTLSQIQATANGRIRSVASVPRNDWEASTTATIELPSPDQLFARPYTYALLRARWFPPRKNLALLKAILD